MAVNYHDFLEYYSGDKYQLFFQVDFEIKADIL